MAKIEIKKYSLEFSKKEKVLNYATQHTNFQDPIKLALLWL
jgi:hypothetical protein